MSAHSPGPWRWIEEPTQPPRKRLVDADGNDVAWGYVATPYDDDFPTGVDAEPYAARLIADAPMLLEELKHWKALFGHSSLSLGPTTDALIRRIEDEEGQR